MASWSGDRCSGNAALAYIKAHRVEVEVEYQQVLKEAEELRQYYEEQNRERVARSDLLKRIR